jgi:hypothetical protein
MASEEAVKPAATGQRSNKGSKLMQSVIDALSGANDTDDESES